MHTGCADLKASQRAAACETLRDAVGYDDFQVVAQGHLASVRLKKVILKS